MGVDSFKTDFGERIPTDVVYHNGSDPVRMHNYYTYLYNQCVFNALKEKMGEGGAAVFARSATAGSQKFPVHWGGDCYSDFPSMAESLRGGLSLGLSGFGFWSHDIGGFEGMPPASVYKRWIAFGLLSSHSRLHGSTSYRVPWNFDEEACDVLRTFTHLKCSLMPYLFAKAIEAKDHGWPVMRAMLMEFPEDPACHSLDRQYMLGDKLLVAPVFSDDGEVSYYVPEGTWTDWFSGRKVAGGRWIREKHGFLTAPLLIRPNSVIPIGSVNDRPDYDFTSGVNFQVFELEEGLEASCEIPSPAGEIVANIKVRRENGQIKVSLRGDLQDSKVTLVNVNAAYSSYQCSIEKSERGMVLTPETGNRDFRVDLKK
jgi:alpha-D-xyloside xylohydrolase